MFGIRVCGFGFHKGVGGGATTFGGLAFKMLASKQLGYGCS